MSKQEQAQQDYLAGMKYKDIADKYQVSLNTVKSWKKRYGWQRTPNKKGAHKTAKRVHTKVEKGAPQNKGSSGDLTPQQELFAQLVGGKRIPLYRAYQAAYSENRPSLAAAMTASSRLKDDPKVHARIVKISQETARKHDWSLDRVVDSYTFIHDESKADIVTHGVRKATADAMIQSLEDITDVLSLKPEDTTKARKLLIETKLRELEYKQASGEDEPDDKHDSLIEALKASLDKTTDDQPNKEQSR